MIVAATLATLAYEIAVDVMGLNGPRSEGRYCIQQHSQQDDTPHRLPPVFDYYNLHRLRYAAVMRSTSDRLPNRRASYIARYNSHNKQSQMFRLVCFAHASGPRRLQARQ
jgi:hypothetical protein